MTGYSFSTPVRDGRAWVRAAPAEDNAAPVAVMAEVPRRANGPEGMPEGTPLTGGSTRAM